MRRSSTWTGASFASLAITPGTYVYTGGNGADVDSVTVNIKAVAPHPAAAPVPTMSAYALALTALGLLVVSGRRLRATNKRH